MLRGSVSVFIRSVWSDVCFCVLFKLCGCCGQETIKSKRGDYDIAHSQKLKSWLLSALIKTTWLTCVNLGSTHFHCAHNKQCDFVLPGDYCEVNLCHNGGTCVTGVGDDPFICICADGFGGDTCNLTETGTWQSVIVFDLCRSCCLLTTSFFSLFSGPCSPNPCKNDGLCEVVAATRRGDVFNEYICKCRPGFEGVHCQTSKFPLEALLVCLFVQQLQ